MTRNLTTVDGPTEKTIPGPDPWWDGPGSHTRSDNMIKPQFPTRSEAGFLEWVKRKQKAQREAQRPDVETPEDKEYLKKIYRRALGADAIQDREFLRELGLLDLFVEDQP
jgi:hypothetical protein